MNSSLNCASTDSSTKLAISKLLHKIFGSQFVIKNCFMNFKKSIYNTPTLIEMETNSHNPLNKLCA